MTHWTHAVQRWWPTHAEPLRVRLHLSSPVAHDSYRGLTAFEGALQTVVVERETGMVASEAMGALGRVFDIPIPIADTVIHGRTIARCSHAQWPVHAIEDKRNRRRRPDVEGIARDKIMVTGGAFKALDLPVPTRIAAWVDVYCVGDRNKLEDLARDLMGVARDCRRGFGAIVSVEIAASEDRSLEWRGRPMRSIPIESEHEAGILWEAGTYEVREETTRAPYWLQRSLTLCAVPVPS